MSKRTALHVHHAVLCISLISLDHYGKEIPYAIFCGGCKDMTNSPFVFEYSP